MLRVHLRRQRPRDVDANQVDIGPSGTLTLHRVVFRRTTDPGNLRESKLEASLPEFVAAWSGGNAPDWLMIENLEVGQPALGLVEEKTG